jgi:hypothetical protein
VSRVQGPGFRIRVRVGGLRVEDLEYRIQSLGFRIYGSGLRTES